MRYIYGPVASRRLGNSLGIDLVPCKVCSFDCIYCQLGRTTTKTLERKPYVPAGPVLEELEEALGNVPRPDYITIAGSGEPTLNSGLGKIVEGIRGISEIPIAVITNSSLLGQADVAAACRRADLVAPSLDAAGESTFQAVNRPCSGLSLRDVVEGMVSFREGYQGKVWLEVMMVRGINDGERQVAEIAGVIDRIGPDLVQLNTVARPPSEGFALPAEKARLEEIASFLGEKAVVVGEVHKDAGTRSGGPDREAVRQCIRRRPCTIEDVSAALGVNYVETSKVLAEMVAEGYAGVERHDGRVYYSAY